MPEIYQWQTEVVKIGPCGVGRMQSAILDIDADGTAYEVGDGDGCAS